MSRWRRNLVVALSVSALIASGCQQGGEPARQDASPTGEPASVSIVAPSAGATVEGNVVTLELAASGVEIVAPDGDTSGATGHFHAFMDRDPVAPGDVIPKEEGIVHSSESEVTLYGLSVGEHRVVVVLGDGTHARIGESQAETTINVEGPSVDASAPMQIEAGAPLRIEVAVEGVMLLPGLEDTSGRAGTHGHLHVLVDEDPAPGEPLPPEEAGVIHTVETEIEIEDLASGEHTVWVVLGYADHTPFEPAVMDKLTVTVG